MIELRSGPVRAAIDPDRGSRLCSLTIDGREIVVTPPDAADRTILWGTFLMAPWVGRIENAVFDWDGVRHELPAAAEGHALHGVVWDQAWTVERSSSCDAALSTRLETGGWPFRGLVRQSFELGDTELTISAEIVADEPMPAALGWHPWFLRSGEDPQVTVTASEVLETRGLIPTGRRLPVDAITDLRTGTEFGVRLLDHCYPDARSPAIVEWPELTFEIAFDPVLSSVVVHNRAGSFCIEPQTAWPNAVVLEAAGVRGTGLVRLAAGERLGATMTWRWR